MFLENRPGHITAEAYDAPDTSEKFFLSGGVRPERPTVFADSHGKICLIGVFLISCMLQLLYPVYYSEAETFKYIKIGEHETSTRIVKAAKLRYIKIGEHENYTRIVFEFKEPVRYNTPVIRQGGKFAVVFFDTTTALPRQIRVDATERVEGIEFEQQESNLNADVSMSFPQFRIKTFALAEPDRLVIDVFRLETPVDIAPGNIVLQKMMFKDSKYNAAAEKDVIRKTVEPEIVEEKTNADMPRGGGLTVEPPVFAKTAADTANETGNFIVNEEQRRYDPEPIVQNDQAGDNTAGYQKDLDFITNRMTKKGSGTDKLQVYLLPVLTVLSVIIILLLVFIVFQKKKSVDFTGFAKRLNFLKTNDETIAAINAKINREIQRIK